MDRSLPQNWFVRKFTITINRDPCTGYNCVEFIINSRPSWSGDSTTGLCVVEIAIRASGSWPPAKSFQFSQILRRTVYLFTFPCASWCTRYNGFTYRFLRPPPPVIPGECTKLERGRSSTPKRSKLTPHFRKRIFCCAVYPLLVVCMYVCACRLTRTSKGPLYIW